MCDFTCWSYAKLYTLRALKFPRDVLLILRNHDQNVQTELTPHVFYIFVKGGGGVSKYANNSEALDRR